MIILHHVIGVYQGSDSAATVRLYTDLAALGPAGELAAHLLRACKTSERAKVYRGRGYRTASYDRKQWAMGQICKLLGEHADLVSSWGWGLDEKEEAHRHVLYVDLRIGQVSFHTAQRGDGPDYPGVWDGKPGMSPQRVCAHAAALLAQREIYGKVLAS